MNDENTFIMRKWTAQEDFFLKDNWGRMPHQLIADRLMRTLNSVKKHAQHLGLTTRCVQKRKHRAVWSIAEAQWLQEHKDGKTPHELAEMLCKTEKQVICKLEKMGEAPQEEKSQAMEFKSTQPVEKYTKYKRRCHDCGKPCNDYRCPECWRKVWKKNGCTPYSQELDFDE